MDEIKTKYIAPKDGRGSRIRAYCKRGSISIPYPYALQPDDRYKKAEMALVEKLAKKEAKKDFACRMEAADELARVARLVIDKWQSGLLAAAVRQLDEALEVYNNAKGKPR